MPRLITRLSIIAITTCALALPSLATAGDVDLGKVAISVKKPSYTVGTEGLIYISVKPMGGLTVKEDAKFVLQVNDPGAALTVPVRTRDNPDKVTARYARFNVKLTPRAAGAHKLSGSVTFTACSPDGSTCKTGTKTFRTTVTVK